MPTKQEIKDEFRAEIKRLRVAAGSMTDEEFVTSIEEAYHRRLQSMVQEIERETEAKRARRRKPASVLAKREFGLRTLRR